MLFSLPIDLARQLRKIPTDTEVRIAFVAEEETKTGGTFKRFTVAVRKGTPLLADPDTVPTPVDDVPPAPTASLAGARPRERRTPRW